MGQPHNLINLLNHLVHLGLLHIQKLALLCVKPLSKLIKCLLNLSLGPLLLVVYFRASLLQSMLLLVHFLDLGGYLNLEVFNLL